VDRHDPAFSEPSKPIGSHMDEAKAKALAGHPAPLFFSPPEF